jgi:hypothetical protein
MNPANPFDAANQLQAMAGKTEDKRLAMALTVMSTALVALMLIKEAGKVMEGHYVNKWQEREMSRRLGREEHKGR